MSEVGAVPAAEAAAVAADEAALLELPPVEPDRVQVLGPHPDQRLDWYEPQQPLAAAPLVVLVHGGFWRAAYDRGHLSPFARALAGEGMRVALPEFRRVGSGGGWPVTLEDVTAAVSACAEVATGPVLLLGHSAGGHLVLSGAGRGLPVHHVVAVAPVADLVAAHESALSDGAVAAFCGPGPGLEDRIAEADPIGHPPRGLPVTLLHGTADAVVPVAFSRRYATAVGRPPAEAGQGTPAARGAVAGAGGVRGGAPGPAAPGQAPGAGAPVALLELPGVGHFAPVTPGTPACHQVTRVLRDAAAAAG
ncbi:alpha/beta hydrolase family protein [Streptomyces sp. NPDC059740]|uniref:alpha/beta hydrolase family protein n=1 Tax=Streptomyces sp. NPDC059740 TaxID=3346926 RepID=UPI003666665A